MTSNAYIATDGETVMKVGKSNDVKRREKELAIRITRTIACIDEAVAYRVENQLREFVIQRGGIQHRSTIDWFKFDPQIYAMLYEFAAGLNNETVAEIDIDTEIAQYIMRYHQLLVDEAKAEMQRLVTKVTEAEEQVRRLRQENLEQSEQIHKLSRQVGMLEAKCKILKEEWERGTTKDKIDGIIKRIDKIILDD